MQLSVQQEGKSSELIDLAHILGDRGPEVEVFIGRSDDCVIRLDDKRVSRKSAGIKQNANNAWEITTVLESEPIIVNGHKVNESVLKSGDIISIGPYRIRVEGGASENNNSEGPVGDESFEDIEKNPSEMNVEDETSSQEFLNDGPEGPEETNINESKDFQSETGQEHSFDDDTEDPFEDSFSGPGEDSFSSGEFESSNESGDNGHALVHSDDEKTQIFGQFLSYSFTLTGEHAPYDRFIFDKESCTIGRSKEDNDIFIDDPEVSLVHARISRVGPFIKITDEKSSNGIILNGERVNSQNLDNGDEFLIGTTSFTVHLQSNMIEQESDRLMPVDENQEVEVFNEISADLGDEDVKISGKESFLDKFKDPKERKKLLVGAVVLVGLWAFLPESKEEESTEKKTNTEKEAALSNTKAEEKASTEKELSNEERQFVENSYLLASSLIEQGEYKDALLELDKVERLDPNYKQTQSLLALAKEGLAEIEELKRRENEEIEKKIRAKRVSGLIVKARKAVDEKRVEVAQALFSKILEIDPENYDVPPLKLEIEAWKREEDRKALEKAQKVADRKRMVDELAPGKTFFLKGEWYKAIIKLDQFLQKKQMDADLVKNAGEMLKTSQQKLSEIISPLLSKARSLKESQDLKGAYEVYVKILEEDPSYKEALEQSQEMRESLTRRSKKVYREGLISESLSDFQEAREKFIEVKQISPKNSEYYNKADLKLKDYLD